MKENDTLSIYPNPAKEYIHLELCSDKLQVPLIRIIDLTGKVVLKLDKEFISEQGFYKVDIDISDLKAGIYFVKVIQEEKVFSKKLMVR